MNHIYTVVAKLKLIALIVLALKLLLKDIFALCITLGRLLNGIIATSETVDIKQSYIGCSENISSKFIPKKRETELFQRPNNLGKAETLSLSSSNTIVAILFKFPSPMQSKVQNDSFAFFRNLTNRMSQKRQRMYPLYPKIEDQNMFYEYLKITPSEYKIYEKIYPSINHMLELRSFLLACSFILFKSFCIY